MFVLPLAVEGTSVGLLIIFVQTAYSSIEEAVILVLDYPVTGARCLTQPTFIQDFDLPTAVVDYILFVQTTRRRGDPAAPHT